MKIVEKGAGHSYEGCDFILAGDAVPHGFSPFASKVKKTPSWPRSWANFSPLWLCSHWNAWASWHILGALTPFSLKIPTSAEPAAAESGASA